MLHAALERAVVGKKAIRNVASIVKAQKVPQKDVAVLRSDQIGELLNKIRDHRLCTLVVVALGTGLRRGELLALRWHDIDPEARSLRVERSLGEADGKLYFKSPKSQAGRRSLSLAATVVEGGLDEYVISRRIGHGSASLTLKAYTHLLRSKEDQAAEAIESA